MPINNKTHSVAYTGSYTVILLYIIVLVDDKMTARLSSIALFKYFTSPPFSS